MTYEVNHKCVKKTGYPGQALEKEKKKKIQIDGKRKRDHSTFGKC